ncbi:MAG: histidinol-phosphate transaminase [Methanobacteriota archaeon]
MAPKVRRSVEKMKPYVPGRPLEDVEREFGFASVVKLASNESPIGPSEKALAAIETGLARLHRYPEPTSRGLREAIAERWGCGPDGVFVGNGSDEVFRLLAETYVEAGDRVVYPAPSFSVYRMAAEIVGAEPVAVPLSGLDHDLPAMARAAKSAKLVFLCRPNNPTGTVFGADALAHFLAEVSKDTIVVLDEAYAEFDASGFSSREFLAGATNLVVSRTFAKAYGLAGLRVGYAVGAPSLLAPLFTVRDPFSVSRVAQDGGLAALRDEPHLEKTVRVVAEGRDALYRIFERRGLPYVRSEANFVLVELGDRAAERCDALLRLGVVVRHTGSFGLPRHVRVSVGTKEEIARFDDALDKVLRVSR